MSLEMQEASPPTEGTAIAVPSRLYLAERPAARAAIPEYCPATPRRVNVQSVGGSDAVLAARLVAGDDYALAEAFDALARSVYASALGVLGDKSAAQDVVQDVFIELWARPDRYDPAAGTLRAYVTVLARHRAVDLVRSELRRVARQERSHRLRPATPAAGVDDELMAAETVSLVRAAVQRLPASQRQVVEKAYFEGLTYREVARAVGIPEGTAKSRLRLALAKLEEMLDRQLLESS
jgi:RNA polymerase sigma-70 factor (ECF subfamily)